MIFSTGLIFVLTVLNIFVYYLRKHQEEGYVQRKDSSSLSSDQLCCRFSLAEIKLATHNFDEALVIGKGGFGKVYKGAIHHGSTAVAIKRLNFDSNQGATEFWTEIKMLSMFRHSHLVSLLGYCEAGQEMILVYEYMPNGTLEDHLHKRRRRGSGSPLTWVERLRICIGAARGLDYLHTGTGVQRRVIHRDVKSSNILLDDNWEAKISDFGLSRIGPANHSCTTHVYTNQIRGTFGYMDVEYFLTRRLTRKSDVYAFGVVLCEVLCGRPAIDCTLDEQQHGLAGWAKHCIQEGKIDQIMDPCLRGQIVPHCLKEFGEIAYKCLLNRPKDRATMAEVVARLEFALAIQEGLSPMLEAETASRGIADDNEVVTDSFGEEDIISINESGGHLSVEPTATDFPMLQDGVGSHGGAVIDSTEQKVVHVPQSLTSPTRHGGRVTFLKKVWSVFSTKAPAFSVVGDKRLEAWRFAFTTIKVATDNFSDAHKLASDADNSVYKGTLQNGQRIAVKIFTIGSQYTEYELGNVLLFLPKLQHRNVIQFLGFCVEGKKMHLIHEFMPCGTLKDQIMFDRTAYMVWDTRYHIILGVARGLLYLHRELPLPLIHLDLRTENILLDDLFNPKISSFGAARFPSPDDSHFTDRVAGTIGYLDPEFLVTGRLSPKVDVFSFGVLVLEIVSGQRISGSKDYLRNAWRSWREGRSSKFKDRAVVPIFRDSDQAMRCLQIGLLCVQLPGEKRPTMASVVRMLSDSSVILPAPTIPYGRNSESDMILDGYFSGDDEDS